MSWLWIALGIACAFAAMSCAHDGYTFLATVFLVLAVLFLMSTCDSKIWSDDRD